MVPQQFFLTSWDMWLHCNHICHTPGSRHDQHRGRETDPLIHCKYGFAAVAPTGDQHHLLPQQPYDTAYDIAVLVF
jgi:hypothetical protein